MKTIAISVISTIIGLASANVAIKTYVRSGGSLYGLLFLLIVPLKFVGTPFYEDFDHAYLNAKYDANKPANTVVN